MATRGKRKIASIPYDPPRYTEPEMTERARAFREEMERRRTIRHFSDQQIPWEVIEEVVRTASTAPSGAHKQPWSICVVTDPAIKKQIRTLAEEEEYKNYHGRMSEEWLDDLTPFETDWNKPFLETAPALIVVFKRAYEVDEFGEKHNNYYVSESVGIATGMLLTAIHHAGLFSLTHTPSPMNFLAKVLGRPENERPFLLIPVGYPAESCRVPDLQRKALDQVLFPYR